MQRTLLLRLPRAFGLRGNRREARRDVVLRGLDDRDPTRILCDRRIGNRERERERERKDGRGLEHSLVSLTKDARWLRGRERYGAMAVLSSSDAPIAPGASSDVIRARRRAEREESRIDGGFRSRRNSDIRRPRSSSRDSDRAGAHARWRHSGCLSATSSRSHLPRKSDVGRTSPRLTSRRVKGRLLAGVLLCCLALTACGGPASGSGNETAADALNRGLAAHAAGKLDEAVAAYFTTLSKDPKNQFAYYNLGEIAQRQSRFVAAESYYRIALEMDPKMVSALFNLAIVRTNAGATNEAIALYRQAIAVDANYAAAHFNLGLLLRQIGQTAEAQTELATAQKLDPTLVAPSPSASPIRQASPSPTR
ncbi:MAG: tetratricopeptide repeat protein [Chloroflexi bacterium]|nr:MAG: tetratricopeptide repeat protein [Chloroflexota bacterium]